MQALVLLLIFLGGLLGMDGFREAQGSAPPMGRMIEVEDHG